MKLLLPKLQLAPPYYMRLCGYLKIENPHKNNEESYARSLEAGRFYPRFHVYIETTNQHTGLNLHLDAKKPSYEGTSAHSGEYDGDVVESEGARLTQILTTLHTKPAPPPTKLGF